MNIPECLLDQSKQLKLRHVDVQEVSNEFVKIVDYLTELGLDVVYIYHIFGYEYKHDDKEAYEYLTHC